MKSRKLLTLAALIAIAGVSVNIAAQSGREKPSAGTKSNQRPAEPPPSQKPLAKAEPEPERSVTSDDGEVIKVDTQLVTIPVRVMDRKGRSVGGLAKESFKVFEDGVEKEISLFSNEQQPFTVALVLDMSPSSTFKVDEIQSAAIAFIDQLRPQDKVMVISFDQDVHMLCEVTNDRKGIYRAIKSTKIGLGTSLYEAIDLVINRRLNRIEGRKAIILFTDGVDTTSLRATALNNLSDVMELDALIYPIRYDTYADVQKMKNKTSTPPILGPISLPGGSTFPIPLPSAGQTDGKGTTAEEYERARDYLDQLAIRTSGTVYLASTRGDLTQSFAKIASELREFYSLGIYPDDIKVGKTRKLKVRVDREGLAVRARDNYIVRKK